MLHQLSKYYSQRTFEHNHMIYICENQINSNKRRWKLSLPYQYFLALERVEYSFPAEVAMNSMLRDVLFVLAVFGVLMDVLQCDAGKTPGSDNDAAAIVISALHSQPGDNNSGLAVAQNIVPTPKFVKCRPLKTDYSIRNDPNQIKQL